ncbi:MAG: V-type ATP synthase subunit I [Bacteroidales bacterium]|nr:V-type ATP synthase subunit I [Bacteroidales bacterium]
MKKYHFLIYHKIYDEFVESIQQAGVVHIVQKQKGVPDAAVELRGLMDRGELLKNAIKSLQQKADSTGEVSRDAAEGISQLEKYRTLASQQDDWKMQQQSLRKEIDNMSVWGHFDLDMLQKIETSGRRIRFYSCRERDFRPEWKDRFDAIEINHIGAMLYFVTLTPIGVDDEPDAEKIQLSGQSLRQLETALHDAIAGVEAIDKAFVRMAEEHIGDLQEAYCRLRESIDLSEVRLQTEKEADNHLILLEGWVPEIKEAGLKAVLDRLDVYYIATAPAKDDNSVPVLLRNNWFARLFEPIGDLYDMPNYHELDLTPLFAPFYLLFFGLCLGDAGYGLLLLVAGLVLRVKMKPAMKPLMSLVAILGAATFVCGSFCATFFGIPLLDVDWAWLASFKKFMLNSDNLFYLALILGGVQIIFGMIVKAIGQVRRYGWSSSLETWGWLILLVGGGSLYLINEKALITPAVARNACYVVLAVAGVLIFILNKPGRNPLVNIGAGLWSSYNMVTGLLGDLLSYIRLFALGLCGGVMGFVFNDLAIQMSGNIPVVSQIVMLIIMLIGHSLNIFMSGLGAFVHPMRLTFVEFYKNSGFEGGGKKYKPLKLMVNDK